MLIISISGCINSSSSENGFSVNNNQSTIQESEKSFEVFLEECEKIENLEYKNACYAGAYSDVGYCENLSNDEWKSICNSDIYFALKTKTGFSSTEDYLPDFAKECKDMEKQGITSSECIFNDMRKENNPEECSKLWRNETKDNCFFEVSIRLRDSTSCDSIIDESKKEECISLNNFEPDSSEYCLAFNSEIDQRECLSDLAIKLNDTSYCNQFERAWDKDACYIEMTSKSDQNYCELIGYEKYKSYCWVVVAVKEKDESICESSKVNGIENPRIMQEMRKLSYDEGSAVKWYDEEPCYLYVALAKQDSSLCEKTLYPDTCYYEYVVESIDLANTERFGTFAMLVYDNIYKYNT